MHDLDRRDLVFESNSLDEGAYLDSPGEISDLDSPREIGDAYGADKESEAEGIFDPVEQSELASELLEVGDDQELDQFLGDLIKKAKKRLGPISNIVTGNVGGLLKGALKTALPKVAGLAGGAFGGPLGAVIASKAAPALGSLLGLELEGLSAEDQEFEAAKQLVRMAGAAVQNAANAGPTASPVQTAQQAVLGAARQFAPGLTTKHRAASGSRQRGHWYRKGNRIILVGV